MTKLIIGLFLLATTPARAQQTTDIWVVALRGGEERRLTNHTAWDEEPEWSPDGRWIIFDSNRNGNHDVFIMRSDGTELRQLTSGPAKEDHAAWSADGEWVVYQYEFEGNKMSTSCEPTAAVYGGSRRIRREMDGRTGPRMGRGLCFPRVETDIARFT